MHRNNEFTCSAGDTSSIWAQEDPLEKEIATLLARKIPWTEEAVGLQSLQSQRVRHD